MTRTALLLAAALALPAMAAAEPVELFANPSG